MVRTHGRERQPHAAGPGHNRREHLRLALVRLRSAVVGVVGVGVGRHPVGCRVAGGLRVHVRGELQFEAVRFGAHVEDLEGGLPAPHDALQAPAAVTGRAPAAVGLADEHRAVRREGHAVDAGVEAVDEGEAGALVVPVDLLEVDAHHRAHHLVAHEQLLGEGAEGAARGVEHHVRRGLTHLAVGEPDRRRLGLGGVALQVLGVLAPAQPRGMTDEGVLPQVRQPVRGDVVPLVVHVEHLPVLPHAEAVGGAQAAADRDHLALRRDLQGPAPVGHGRLAQGAAEAHVQGHPGVALAVEARPEGELVVVAGDAPVVADGLVQIRASVAVGVDQARQLGSLDRVEGEAVVLLAPLEAQGLVETLGVAQEAGVEGWLVVGALDQEHVPAPGADRRPPVGQDVEAADLDHQLVGDRDRQRPVVLVGAAGGEVPVEQELELGLDARVEGDLGQDLELPAALSVDDLDEHVIRALRQVEGHPVRVGVEAAGHVLVQQQLTVQPQAEAVVAAELVLDPTGAGRLDRRVEVARHQVVQGPVVPPVQVDALAGPVADGLPACLDAVLALVDRLEVGGLASSHARQLRLRRVGGLQVAAPVARVGEGRELVPRAPADRVRVEGLEHRLAGGAAGLELLVGDVAHKLLGGQQWSDDEQQVGRDHSATSRISALVDCEGAKRYHLSPPAPSEGPWAPVPWMRAPVTSPPVRSQTLAPCGTP